MRSVTVRLDDLRTTVLNLGFVGENEHTQIRIDSKKMFDQYPTASPSLTVCPPDGESYPAVIERDGNFVLWTITDSDLVHEGSGEIQLSFTVSETVAKSYPGRFKVSRSIVPTGEIPEGIDDFLTRAGAALTAIPETIDEALAEAKASGEFDGPPGYSPTATVSKSGKTATITITDKNGTTTAQISDGEDGGTSDYSDLENKPQIAGVTLSGNVSLHDLGAAAESDIPDPTSIIDDTAGDGDTNKVWSADKSHSLLTEINTVENTLDTVLVPENIFDDSTFVMDEQVSTSKGTFVAGNGYMRSDYLPINGNGVVNVGLHNGTVQGNTIVVHYAFYTFQKAKLSTGFGMYIEVQDADDFKYQQITVPEGAAYFAFDASKVNNYGDDFYVSQEQTPTTYVAYGVGRINPSLVKVDKTLTETGIPADAKVVGDKFTKAENAITAMRGGNLTTVKAASLASGEGLYSVRHSIIRNKTLIFNAKVSGDSWSILLAHGVVDNSYDSNSESGGYVVTPTTATIWVNGNDGENGTLGTAWTHGLTINDRLTVMISVDSEQKQTITLMSESGFATKSYTAQFNGRKGKIYAKALAGTFTDAELSFGCSDLEKTVWIFGDSYVSLVDTRYPYWLQQAHMDNCLINSYPGEATPNAILDFRSLITMATPKYIVWGLGMNDHDTSSAVNSDWMDGVEELISTCQSAGITLILCTIPNVANSSCNNVKKNAWIASSGYRYVDFNKAIGAADEPGASWPAGWLSNDNVHPTAMGARVLAGQIMLDVPELSMP